MTSCGIRRMQADIESFLVIQLRLVCCVCFPFVTKQRSLAELEGTLDSDLSAQLTLF